MEQNTAKSGQVKPSKRFFMIPKWLCATEKLSLAAKVLLVILDDHRNRKTGQCNPRIRTLAKESHTPRRTVQRALADLCRLGLIQITWAQRESNYRIAPRSEWSKILMRQIGATENPDAPVWRNALRQFGATEPAVSLLTELDPLNYKKNSLFLSHRKHVAKPAISPTKKPSAESVSLTVYEPEPETFDVWFEQKFWPFYPRKTAKAAALKAARAAGKSPKLRDEILTGLYRQLPNLESREPEFIPHAATWLNQKRWLDEPEPARRPPESERDRNFRIAAEDFLKEQSR
jgi:hypothetical protein